MAAAVRRSGSSPPARPPLFARASPQGARAPRYASSRIRCAHQAARPRAGQQRARRCTHTHPPPRPGSGGPSQPEPTAERSGRSGARAPGEERVPRRCERDGPAAAAARQARSGDAQRTEDDGGDASTPRARGRGDVTR
ncbi:uncharacterized protein ACIB01_017835 isoform 1-T2 [Guaruba guarouba]